MWIDVLNDRPQGRIFKPSLFILYIHAFPDLIGNFAVLLADNTNIYPIVNAEE